jgi:hypothetical protein
MMKCKPLHCWECGIQVIEGAPGAFKATPLLRQVKFGLTGNAYCESTFCVDCAELPWTPERVQEFKDAVDAVSPGFRAYRIVKVEGTSKLTDAIMGIV